jgi:uncharacterized protein (TIGR03437 family)
MLNRVSALCIVTLALSVGLLQGQDLFVLPGPGATNGEVQAFVSNPLTTFRTFAAGVGSFALLPNLDASKYFVVASSNTNSIMSSDATFLSPTLVANLPAPATQALVTPDGKLLVVAAGTVHLFDTATNSELVPGGVGQGSGLSSFSVAASLDSTTLFSLESKGTTASQLTAISTTTYAVTATLALTPGATAVSVAPNGLVYVSQPNQILEVDPRTLQPTYKGAISVSGTPGPLVYTPDGQYAIGANQFTFGNSLFIVTLATHTATQTSLGSLELASLQVIGVDTVLALSGPELYQITISNPISAAQIPIPGVAPTGLVALTVSNDIPGGPHSKVQAAYAASSASVYQYNPATGVIVAHYPVAPNIFPGALAYAVPAVAAVQSRPATLLTYGTNQAVLPGATTEPLVVQVLDVNNLPISGESVQFFSSTSGATLSSTSVITGSNGYALTYLTAPSSTGPITVTAVAGALSATFPIQVSTTAQGAGGPTLTIVAGQGQIMIADTSTVGGMFGTSLQVLATDGNGNPIAGLPVTFSVPPSGGTLLVSGTPGADTKVVNTNSAGVASVDFQTTTVSGDNNQGYLQSLVTASATNTNAVTFYITAVDTPPSIYLLAPSPGTPLTGSEGSTLPGAVRYQVSIGSSLIPNVSLSLNDGNVNPSLFPSLTCNAPGGFVLSNSAGIASCDVLFGPRLGSGTFIATIGFTQTSIFPIPFIVTTGAPSTVQVTQGNNQIGNAGQKLPLALLVHVTDSGGNTIVGAPVAWQVLTAGAVTLSNVVSITDHNGNASAVATLGAIGGVAQVQATAGNASATFNLTVNIPSVGIQKVSGDRQTAVINAAFALPLIVKVVDSNANGVPGAQVNFQVASGAATLGSSSVITDSTGQASTTVTAGATPGAITVTAASSTFSVTFNLTVRPNGPSNIAIVNGASFDPNTGVSPGSIANVSGLGILPGFTGLLVAPITNGQYPTTFSGVTITFNGIPAPIYYVEDTNGADQVAVQIPFEVQPGPAVTLTVSVANETPASVVIPVRTLAPGIFDSIYGGKIYAVAVRPDNTQVSPTNPAQRGENIQLYVTGLGQASPTIMTGAAGVPNQTLFSPLVVGLNNSGVPLISAVYAPGLIGVYIVILHVPEDTQTGPYQPIGLIGYDSAHNQYYAQNTYLPIQ